VTLAAPGVPELQAWLSLRAENVTTGRQSVIFCTHAKSDRVSGQPLDSGYVRAMLARVVSRTEIDK